MSSCRINLLKLIDLAIGSPHPGSVNFNLLHKILYILALRDGPITDFNEIELTTSSGIVDQRLLSDALRDGGQTRLTVQRISSGSVLGGAFLRIAGSRIMFPCDNSIEKISDPESDRIESQMSAMSSMVSELEERVQEISLKPSPTCAEAVDDLRRRIDELEALIEHQVDKISNPVAADNEEPQVNSTGQDETTERIWETIRMLESKLDAMHENNKCQNQDIRLARVNEENPLAIVISSSNVPANDTTESEDININEYIRTLESRLIQMENNLQSLKGDTYEERGNEICPNDDSAPSQVPTAEQLAMIQMQNAAKMEQLEHLINRLFQDKTDDGAIESRIRQSIRLTSNETQRKLSEQLDSNRNEIQIMREEINSKASQANMQSLVDTLRSQIQELHVEIQTLRSSQSSSESKTAAGSKNHRPLENVRCISCDRNVTMDACIEIIPKSPLFGAGKTLKPNLQRQLNEARKNLEHQRTAGGTLRNLYQFEKVYRSIKSRNRN